MPSMELHIERLVLEGVAYADRNEVARAVERELVRLFTERGVPESWSSSADISRVLAMMPARATGERHDPFGVRIAEAVYGGLG